MNKKIIGILLAAVLLTAATLVLCSVLCNRELDAGDILRIAQRAYEEKGGTMRHDKEYYVFRLEKFEEEQTWSVRIQTESKDPNLVIMGGGCDIYIDGKTGEVLSCLFLV